MPLASINNEIYDTLRERWYEADDDPVALLRAEAAFRNPWVLERIQRELPSARVLDIGCGAGFLANLLASKGHQVTGIDSSPESLAVAHRYDATGKACYLEADACHLPFADGTFDVACAMDFLEHVEDPGQAIAEASRVLRPGGMFFFYTFDRTLLSWLLVIKGMEWFVRNTPERLHLHSMFIRPAELRTHCLNAGLQIVAIKGVRPRIFTSAMVQLLFRGTVSPRFSFLFTPSTRVAYLGLARKERAIA